MAREPKVTRTIGETSVTAQCADIAQGVICEQTFLLPLTEQNNEKVLKYLKKCYETEVYKILRVLNTEIIYNRYAMPQSTFIELATEITPVSEYGVEDASPDEPHPVN